jgi:hypothetical protein
MEQLHERATLPDYMLEQVTVAAENGISAKEYLENTINQHQRRFYDAVRQQLTGLRSDTAATADDYIDVLDGIQEPTYRYAYIDKLLAKGQTNEATIALENMATYCHFNEKQAALFGDYSTLYNMLIGLAESNRSIEQLTSGEKEILQNLSGNNNAAQSTARAILQHLDNGGVLNGSMLTYHEPVYFPNATAQRKKNSVATNTIMQNKIVLFPNPTKNYATVSYTLQTPPNDAYLEVIDASGRIAFSKQLTNEQDDLVLNTEKYNAGVYMVRISVNKVTLATQKLTIIK